MCKETGMQLFSYQPIEAVRERIIYLQKFARSILVEGEDFYKIPGYAKEVLGKSGAEKLNLSWSKPLTPRYPHNKITTRYLPGEHIEYTIVCELYSGDTIIGEGMGCCSTMETKYRYRKAERKCPECGSAVMRGKKEYGGGWLCWQKKGGCGAKFDDNDPVIVSQPEGRIENTDTADLWNTCLKMACKRAYVAATLSVNALSHMFTQDVEEDEETEVKNTAKETEIKIKETKSEINGFLSARKHKKETVDEKPAAPTHAEAAEKPAVDIKTIEAILLIKKTLNVADDVFNGWLMRDYGKEEANKLCQADAEKVLGIMQGRLKKKIIEEKEAENGNTERSEDSD